MENKPINEGNEGNKKTPIGIIMFIVSFFVTLLIIILLLCWWSNSYTPPQPRMMNEKKVVEQKNREARKNKSVTQKLPSKSGVAKTLDPEQEVVIPPSRVVMEKKVAQVMPAEWEPVISVSGDIRYEIPNVRAVPTEAGATEERVISTRVIVVEAPPRQDRLGYVYGAYGNNSDCGWWNNNCGGWNGGAGIYCNSLGTGPWPCQQLQNNFVNQQPLVVHHHHRHRNHHPQHAPPAPPPPVVFPQPATPPHHHNHGSPVPPAPSGGPVNPGGMG